MLATPVLAKNSEDALRWEMEVNVFGMLAMAKALAPVLQHNGGGVIVNMLSVVSWYVYPFNATYCATKGKTVEGIRAGLDHVLADERAESLWQAVRQELAKLHAGMQARWDQHTASMSTKV